MRSIRAMHWKNIHPDIIAAQKAVLKKIGYDIIQDEADLTLHGDWLTTTLENAPEDEVFLFLDIDSFPTRADIVEQAFAAAEAGRLFGVAQNAVHLPNHDFIYAAPSFLAVSRRTWVALGKPDMVENNLYDTGMALSVRAVEQNVPIDFIYPSFVCVPRWLLVDQGCYGIGTFYERGAVFHLFESRRERGYREAFLAVAQSVTEGRPIDYPRLHAQLNHWTVKFARWKARQGQLRKRFVQKHILRKSMAKQRAVPPVTASS